MKLLKLILSVSLGGVKAQNETQIETRWRKPKEFEIVAAYEEVSLCYKNGKESHFDCNGFLLTEYCRARHHCFQTHIHPKSALLGQNQIFNGISVEKNLQDSFENQQFKII